MAVLLASGGCSGNKEQETTEQPDTAIPVTLAKVEYTDRTDPVRTAGTVTSLGETRLSFKVGGVIDRVFVMEGQAVRAGELLATLNMTEIAAQVDQAELALEKSRRDLERVDNMLRDSAATLEQLQNARTGFDVAEKNLGIARFNRDFAKIVSPVAGTIARKLMNGGEVAGPGAPVLVLMSDRRNDWVVKVGVSDRDWARLKAGDRAEIMLDAYPDRNLAGVVSFLSQVADPLTHLYDVEIRLTGDIPRMASGLFAKVSLWPSRSRGYRVIPVEALLEGHGPEGYVFVIEDGVARKKAVTIGYLDHDKVLLTAGPDSTAMVVTGGSAFLTEGARVSIP